MKDSGNALLEVIYFRKPVLINRYSIFIRDIELKLPPAYHGWFRYSIIAKRVKQVLEDQKLRQEIVDHNYEVARQFIPIRW